MTVAALLDAGADMEILKDALEAFRCRDLRLK